MVWSRVHHSLLPSDLLNISSNSTSHRYHQAVALCSPSSQSLKAIKVQAPASNLGEKTDKQGAPHFPDVPWQQNLGLFNTIWVKAQCCLRNDTTTLQILFTYYFRKPIISISQKKISRIFKTWQIQILLKMLDESCRTLDEEQRLPGQIHPTRWRRLGNSGSIINLISFWWMNLTGHY